MTQKELQHVTIPCMFPPKIKWFTLKPSINEFETLMKNAEDEIKRAFFVPKRFLR